MAELPALEEFLLGGYDVSALLHGAPSQAAGQSLGVLGLEAQLQQLKATGLPQQALGWAAATAADQNDLYQKVAHSLAAKLEEHRMQQVQVANALQQLQALQQQQELAHLQQQISALHQQVPRASNPFQRSRTTDLESLGRGSSFDVSGPYGPALEYEHQKQLAALQQAANPTTQLAGLQRIHGIMGQHNHNLPVRSFSSEHLVAGQRRSSNNMMPPGPGQPMLQGMANSKRPPIRQPSGLGPNGRGGQSRGAEGGRRARYAATAKAPSWASEDWHPMKAVIASGAHASGGGTGVFLPHLAASSNNNNNNNGGGKPAAGGGGGRSERNNADTGSALSSGNGGLGLHHHALNHHHHQAHMGPMQQMGVISHCNSSHSPTSPTNEASPSCSAESNAICSANDPYSRQTTLEFSRGSTHSELDTHPPSSFGYLVDTMKVVVEEPEREREEECDFVSLARELAELMSKQVITE